ncbi:MAG TPA: bifunctional oligoribonuclease/PAP phosphatase NrnA [Vicinamibacterales bacterium]|jgi:phosphoesterase RecJ-like protein|nr:bifunctional oligoribonuclease/PAP phosphatase NrnA [Vicinamibacterales bacterium]
MTTTSTDATIAQVADAIRARRRFVVVSHARPDGDAIGSQVAMTLALRGLGKDVRMVAHDPAPQQMQDFPAVADIQLVDHLDDLGDAVIFMECGDARRPGVAGLDKGFVINIDHHPGNAMYGAMNCIDLTAAACGEMVFDLIAALEVPLSVEMATHVYLTILTDTGGFHYSHISPRTFDICRRCVEAGLDPTAVSRAIYDNNNLGRVRIWGAVLNDMRLSADGRVAALSMDRALAERCGASYDDTEGLINFPLTVKEIQAVAFFKESGPGDWRISMRSKGDVNVNTIAREFGGGGHANASGCGATGDLAHLMPLFEAKLVDAVNRTKP